MNETPAPELVAEDTGTQLRVWCRYCRTYHYHGRGAPRGRPAALYGERAAHCARTTPYTRTGYILVRPPEPADGP